jgi:3-hydroxyisobutyrate dehydrogenase-like beta-hydroxyacid dehydrogenase
MHIGFVGLGRMGQAMIPRLLDAGFAVQVWNRTPEKAQPLLEHGAVQAESLVALAGACDIVCTMVTDDRAVEAVYNPQDGLLAGDAAGTLFVEMSTIRPDTIKRLAPQVDERGAALLDSPMSGTVGPAREGHLMALVGGSAEDLERARPVLEVWCRRIAHMGPSSSGALMKLVLNMPMAVYWQALAEALSMGVQGGLDIEQMLNLIADSPAGIGALALKIPQILGQPGEIGFDITGVRKDLLAMTRTGQALDVPMPAASAALLSFVAASSTTDWGERDLAEFIPYYINMVRHSASSKELD